MSTSFELDPVDRITAGAIGAPGSRTFYVQAQRGSEQVTILAEKEQIQVLAQALMQLLAQVPGGEPEGVEDPPPVDLELSEPLDPVWRAGEMSIEYDEDRELVAVMFQEVAPEDPEDVEAADLDTDLGMARFVATRAQVRALAAHALQVVAAGRPRCQLCGLPIGGSEPHVCPSTNGHRKFE